VELTFPIEFIVRGTPVSLQTKRAKSLEDWKNRVRSASAAVIPSPHFASDDRIAVTIYYLPSEPMQGDLDNIIKPILDALSRHIYIDDQQVERIVAQRFGPGYTFKRPSVKLIEALNGEKPALYVKMTNDPLEELPS
jgi:crossover junction endodeoxyribonuclease RusA